MVACIFLGALPVAIGVLALSYLALSELYPLVNLGNGYRWEGYAINGAAIFFSFIERKDGLALLFAFLLFFFFIASHYIFIPLRRAGDHMRQSGFLLLGFAYVTVPLSSAIYMRSAGPWWLFLPVAAAALCDTGAFFTGKTLGKRKLAPSISPGKTVEGAIGGIVFAVAASLAAGKPAGIPIHWRLVLGVVLGLAAIAGDLLESYLKRKAGVKDSGILVAGHGGVLDRIDSHLFALPAACLLKIFLIR